MARTRCSVCPESWLSGCLEHPAWSRTQTLSRYFPEVTRNSPPWVAQRSGEHVRGPGSALLPPAVAQRGDILLLAYPMRVATFLHPFYLPMNETGEPPAGKTEGELGMTVLCPKSPLLVWETICGRKNACSQVLKNEYKGPKR